MKLKTSRTEGNLAFKMPDGSFRTVKATVTSLTIGNTNVTEDFLDDVSITFEILEPFFKSQDVKNSFYTGVTGNLNQFIDYK